VNIFYVINSLVWSLVGGLAGFKYGQLYRDNVEIKRRLSMVESELPDTPDAPAPVAPVRPPRWKVLLHEPSSRQLVGVVVIIMAVLTVISGAFYSHQRNAESNCQTAYFNAYTEALRSRDDLATRSRAGLEAYIAASNDLWLGFLKNAPVAGGQSTDAQRAASIAILNDYLAKSRASIADLQEVDRAKQVFPIPANTCPGAPS
jgi:hypothetical protein